MFYCLKISDSQKIISTYNAAQVNPHGIYVSDIDLMHLMINLDTILPVSIDGEHHFCVFVNGEDVVLDTMATYTFATVGSEEKSGRIEGTFLSVVNTGGNVNINAALERAGAEGNAVLTNRVVTAQIHKYLAVCKVRQIKAAYDDLSAVTRFFRERFGWYEK